MSVLSPSTVVLHLSGADGLHVSGWVTWFLVALILIGLVTFTSGRLTNREASDEHIGD